MQTKYIPLKQLVRSLNLAHRYTTIWRYMKEGARYTILANAGMIFLASKIGKPLATLR